MPGACLCSRTSKNVQQIAHFLKQKHDSVFGISRGACYFLYQAIISPNKIPLTSFAFLFGCSAKQKFDCAEVVSQIRSRTIHTLRSAQDDLFRRFLPKMPEAASGFGHFGTISRLKLRASVERSKSKQRRIAQLF